MGVGPLLLSLSAKLSLFCPPWVECELLLVVFAVELCVLLSFSLCPLLSAFLLAEKRVREIEDSMALLLKTVGC